MQTEIQMMQILDYLASQESVLYMPKHFQKDEVHGAFTFS